VNEIDIEKVRKRNGKKNTELREGYRKQTEREKETVRETERERKRQSERHRERKRQSERERERERERYTHTGSNEACFSMFDLKKIASFVVTFSFCLNKLLLHFQTH